MARGDYPSSKQDQFVLRLPDGLRDKIKTHAEAMGRSMNAEIVFRIEEFDKLTMELDLALLRTSELDLYLDEVRRENVNWREQLQTAHATIHSIGGAASPEQMSEIIERLTRIEQKLYEKG
jgi:hypothetical protein